MSVDATLGEYKQAVDRELVRILDREDSELHRAMRHAVLGGGKRYRPLLLISAGSALGAALAPLLPFACGLELIHCYSLVHDDLPSMDNDDFRRGRPSCHKAYGEAVALLAGDALLTLAFEIMAAAPLQPPYDGRRAAVIEEIGRRAGGRGMIEGQAKDIAYDGRGMSDRGYAEMVEKKTGELIVAAVRSGGLLAGAEESQLASLERYGRHVGAAFQLQDDLADSGTDASSGQGKGARPSFVSLWGEAEARLRLRRHVEGAVAALAEGSLRSEALRRLSEMLLEPA